MGRNLHHIFTAAGLVLFLLRVGNNALLYAGYDISDLQQRCPRADICTQGKQSNLQESENSCCLPCSCDSTCKYIGNCCDRNAHTGNMCHMPVVEQEGLDVRDLEYFMINICLNSSEFMDCLSENVAPWGWLYPVYDPASDLNYYNYRCAECNGVRDYIHWNLKLKSSYNERSLSHCLSDVAGYPQKDCVLSFTPPKEMKIIDHVCSSETILSCNISGLWSKYDAELEQACHTWFSPTLDIFGDLTYANVYCAMCNGVLPAPTDVCQVPEWQRTDLFESLSMILDYKRVQNVIENQPTQETSNVENGQCGKFMVKHPTKDECRTIMCPNGFYRVKQRCMPISTQWLASTYFVQLILTPVDSGVPNMLPWSYITSLSPEERSSPEIWLSSHIAPLYHFQIYGRREEKSNVSYVKDLLVRVGRKRSPLNVAIETTVIRDALNQPWMIKLKGKEFTYDAEFYRYANFIPNGLLLGTNIFIDHNRSISDVEEQEGPPPAVYEELDLSYTDIPDTVLKKTHFCERVRLLQSEWSGRLQDLYLNLGTEISKVLGDSEFDVYTDNDGRHVVEICVEDFNPDNQAGHGGSTSTAAAAIYTFGCFTAMIMAAVAAITL